MPDGEQGDTRRVLVGVPGTSHYCAALCCAVLGQVSAAGGQLGLACLSKGGQEQVSLRDVVVFWRVFIVLSNETQRV